jgi:TP901 family phage tail tape measure protein|nr:MAG TPA: minor tail protein [Caudoviricetes sp.]
MGKELELAIKIGGKIDKSLGSAINAAQSQLNTINKSLNGAGMAIAAGVATVTTKLVVDSVNTYKDYQSALNSAAATAGVERSTAEYEAMDKAAREAGRTTVKTAQESANALEYMALAGWSVEDSTKALMPVLKLSAATGADLATTSDLVTDSMANLGLGIGDLNHYLDVSATANNKSNQTAMQLQEAYLGVGGVLKNLNSPIEESAAVLGVLANRGTKGSEAGTALNAILVNMQKQSGDAYEAMSKLGVSMYDSSGKARSILDVFQEISDKTSGMTEENRNLMYQMIGGKSHLDSFAKIMQGFTTDTADGQKEVYSLVNAFKDCDGALDKLYGIKTDTLEGSLATLNSAYDDMKISIGESIAPILKNSVENLTAKIPDIQNIIINSLEKIIPAASKVLDYVIDNADNIILTIKNIAKAFVGFKIASGTIRGINDIITLFKGLSQISSKVGLAKTLSGVIGSLTGISTAGGTVSGVITGIAGSFAAAVGPATLAAAAIVGFAAAVNAIHERKMNYANGMNEAADGIEKASNALVKYNDIAAEVPQLREVISNPESSTQDVENAKARLQEIADLLSKEYNLTINADTSSLENAVNIAQQLSRTELINDSSKLINKATKGASKYKNDVSNIPALMSEQQILIEQQGVYQSLQAEAGTYYTAFAEGQTSQQQYINRMNELYNSARKAGIEFNYLGDKLTIDNVQGFREQLSGGFLKTGQEIDNITKKLETANKNVTEFDESTKKAGDYLAQALANDVQNKNVYGTGSDVQMLEQLGEQMVRAGANTDKLATQFAAAKAGYTDFEKAVGEGKAAEMAQNFLSYKTAIGDTTESAVQGAALIQNGFENVSQATAKGNDAVLAVINNMKSIGDVQGLFDGLDNNGVAAKLTDMAHAMSLIPENKSISIDANGNFQVIQEAENQIASLQSQGNVNVSVNANGDLSVINTATNDAETLSAIGAVSLQVNASGNIDVLDNAQQKLATVDSKTGQVTLGANDNATPTIQNVQNLANTFGAMQVKPTLSATDNATSTINSVSQKLSALDGKKATTTIVTKYKTTGTPPGHSARGANSWRGGLTYVNDQMVNDPREVIEYRGMRYWYEGENVLANVPKGARIYTAAESKAFIDGSHRNGLDRVPFDGYIAELHKDERVLTADEAENYSENGLFSQAVERVKAYMGESKSDGGGNNSSDDGRQIIFSPHIEISGNGDKETVMQGVRMTFSEFCSMMEEYERDRRRKQF